MAHIEGPFGCPSIDIENNYEVIIKATTIIIIFSLKFNLFIIKVLLLVSGGIGVTPLQGIFNDLFYRYNNNQTKLRKVVFIWSVKDKAMIRALDGQEEEGLYI
jgi:hypothetical protein